MYVCMYVCTCVRLCDGLILEVNKNSFYHAPCDLMVIEYYAWQLKTIQILIKDVKECFKI